MVKLLAVLAAAVALALPAAAQDGPGTLTVFAAASLKGPLEQAAEGYREATGVAVTVSFGGSPALAKQIEQGAPADVFISADEDWMDHVAGKGLILADSRADILGNSLVLVAPAESTSDLAIAPGFDLAGALGDGRLAVADPDAVPAGKYAKAALTALGVWDGVESKLVRAENVRLALAYVAKGEAPLGIVYLTDQKAEPKVRLVGVFPADTHPRIVYPAAALTGAKDPAAARAFVAHLTSDAGFAPFAAAGFVRP